LPVRKKAAKKSGSSRPRKVGQGLWDEPAAIALRPEDGIDATKDLSEEHRAIFARLLSEKMPLEDRAQQLVELAKLTDTKRAPVGLRAIQEINAITGIHDPKPQESPVMFVFPEDTRVSLNVEKVIK
jgi:hypothetical protein